MANDTHKFESRYMDMLIGPFPGVPTSTASAHRCTPPTASRATDPLPGADDKVVPPSQSELIVDALRAKGQPVAYLAYEGEGHGFRRAKNLQRTIEAELDFYGRVFGFTPAGELAPAPIENLPGAGTAAKTAGTKGKSSKG